ncbi:MAG TPA: DUF58 domain-containing protein [Candidatus Dormibacteraeota bacterium]|jgi:uncharacterized protein (DUF58 family)|nr:DUF58 domain-containing protein [Candidatus Dormibacteraeota bacterium]
MSRALLVAALVVLAVLAYLTGLRPAFILAYMLVLLFGIAWGWPRLVVRGLSIRRSIDAGSAVVGTEFEETFELRKRSWLPAPWIEVQDLTRLDGYRSSRILSMARGRVTWRARGIYPRRGWMTFGPTRLVVREPFGIFVRERRAGGRHQVLVHPRVVPMPWLSLGSDEQSATGWRPGRPADYPPETSGVRDYQPSDTHGRIHWGLSLRHQRLMSRTFEQAESSDLWIVLDLCHRAHAGQGAESTLEYAVTLAASISAQVTRSGHGVGLLATDNRGSIIEPRQGERPIMDFLAVADADGTRDLAEADIWRRLGTWERQAVIVITPDCGQGWLRLAPASRCPLLLFLFDAESFGGSPSPLALSPTPSLEIFWIRRGDDLSRFRDRRAGALHV